MPMIDPDTGWFEIVEVPTFDPDELMLLMMSTLTIILTGQAIY